MLNFISLGLYDKKDISIRGLEIVKSCDILYLEYYTSILHSSLEELEKFYGKKIILATREMVEGDDNQILQDAKEKNVAFLVAGDAFSATTHSDLFLRAQEQQIETHIVHNASIMNAIGEVGLQLYQFGKTTSLTFFDGDWKPQTAYDVIKANTSLNYHTLALLDIKVAEPSKEDLAKENYIAQKARFMTISQAIEQLLSIEQERQENVFTADTLCVGISRLGAPDQKVIFGKARDLVTKDFGEPLHTLIIPAKLHFHEEEFLQNHKH